MKKLNLTTKVILPEKVEAPITRGHSVGKLLVLNENNIVVKEINLVSNINIEAIKFGEIIKKIFNNF